MIVFRAISAAFRIFRQRFIRREPVVVPDAIRDARQLVCMECPFFDEALDQCTVCGCSVELKTLFVTEKCPKGRWAA